MLAEKECIILRVKELIELSGMKKSRFAVEAGINASNFGKKLEGNIGFTDNDIKLISQKMNVRIGWLLTGEGQMFKAPEEIRQQVAIDSYRAQMLEKKEEEKSDFESSTILEIYSKCIRQLEDDRAQVRKELEEIKEVRQQLADELGEIRNLKAILHDAINAFNANGSASYRPLIAADDNT